MDNYKKPGLGEQIALFFRYSKMSLKIYMQYKVHGVLGLFAVLCREIVNVLIIYFLLTRFISIKGWDLNEILFLYSFLFMSYSLFVFLFCGIRDFDDMVYSGDLDRFFVRPLGILYQAIASKVDYIATVGHGAIGIVLFVKTSGNIGIHWNLQNIFYFITAIIGGTMIQASIFMFSSTFSFWALKTVNLRNLIFFNSRRFAGYPLSFYSKIVHYILMFIVPFAFVNYFPAQYFLKKPDIEQFWSGFMYLTPFVGIIMLVLAYSFWKFGLKHYSSSGNSAS